MDILFEPDDTDAISPNAIDSIRQEIVEILTRECTQTTMLARIPQLVNAMSMTHKTKTGQLRRIRTAQNLEACMTYAIETHLMEFVLILRCSGLYFSDAFTGLNLDLVDTQPIARSLNQLKLPRLPQFSPL